MALECYSHPNYSKVYAKIHKTESRTARLNILALKVNTVYLFVQDSQSANSTILQWLSSVFLLDLVVVTCPLILTYCLGPKYYAPS